jgi:hypothetical protein
MLGGATNRPNTIYTPPPTALQQSVGAFAWHPGSRVAVLEGRPPAATRMQHLMANRHVAPHAPVIVGVTAGVVMAAAGVGATLGSMHEFTDFNFGKEPLPDAAKALCGAGILVTTMAAVVVGVAAYRNVAVYVADAKRAVDTEAAATEAYIEDRPV